MCILDREEYSNSVTNAVAQSIVQQVTYENTAPDVPESRVLTVSAADGNGATSSATSDLVVTLANNAPSFTSNGTLPAVTEDTANPSGASVTSIMGSLFSDPDTTFTPADTLAGLPLSLMEVQSAKVPGNILLMVAVPGMLLAPFPRMVRCCYRVLRYYALFLLQIILAHQVHCRFTRLIVREG